MGKEAIITINCERYSEKIVDIINLFVQSEWKYYGDDKKTEYLPLGADDDFGWQKDFLLEEELQEIIQKKQDKHEFVGLTMYHENSNVGVTILAKNTKEMVINLDINRKTVEDNREAITDIGWYFSNIVQRFKEKACFCDYVKFEEYID